MVRNYHTFLLTVLLVSVGLFRAEAQSTAPNQLPNLTVWLRADSVVTDINNKVSSWVNCAGGPGFDQTDANKRPTLITSCNGKPMLQFDGVNDCLSAGDNYDLGTNSRTIFVVCRVDNSDNDFTIFAKSLANTADNRFAFLYRQYTFGWWFLIRDDNIHFLSTGSGPLPTGMNVWTEVLDRNAQQTQYYKNGVFGSLDVGGIQGPSYNFTSSFRFLLGAYNDANDIGEEAHMTGEIAEVIIYDRTLLSNERSQIEQYLLGKFGQQINLGPDIVKSYGFCPVKLSAGKCLSNYRWNTNATSDSILVSTPGTYWVSATDVFGSVTRDTIQVSIQTQFRIPDTVICAGTSVVFSTGLTGSYQYSWSTGASTPTLNISAPGIYSLTVTDTSGCTRADTFTVQVDSFAYRVSLGSDDSLCAGNTIALQSGAALVESYLWNTGDTTAEIAINSSGTYSLTMTDSVGCTASDAVNITIVGVAPQVDFEADTVCYGYPTTFISDDTSFSSPIDSFLWDFGGGNSGFGPTTNFTFPVFGTHSVTHTAISASGCRNSITRLVYVIENPTALFAIPSNACLGNAFGFPNSSTPGQSDSISNYYWSFGDGGNSSLQAPLYSYTATGTYSVELIVATTGGCYDTLVNQIVVDSTAPAPGNFNLNYPLRGYVGLSGTVNFGWSQSSDASSYQLQIALDSFFTNFILDTTLSTLNHTISLIAGTYYWRVVARNSCGDSRVSETRLLMLIDLPLFGSLPLWIRADSGIVRDSINRVSRWINSVAGPSFDQGNASKQPVWVDSVWNNKPVIRFNGNQVLSAGDAYDIGMNSRSLFLVSRVDANDIDFALYSKSVAAAADNRFAFLYRQYNFGMWFLFRDDVTTHLGLTLDSVARAATIWTNIADRNTLITKFYHSGVFGKSEAGGIPGSSYDFNSPFRFLLGAYGDANDAGEEAYLSGDIAEMIIYDAALDDSSRYMVEQYLRFKYAPQINLGPDIFIKYGVCPVTLDIGPTFSETRWNTGDSTQSISVDTAGTYWVTAKDLFGYFTTDTITINFPERSSSFGQPIICMGDSTTLTLDVTPANAYSYLWINTLTGDTVANTNVAYARDEAPYIGIIQDTIGCTFISDTIFINVDSFELHALIPEDTSICSGNDIALVPYQYPYISYLWTSPIQISTQPNVIVDSPGVYTVLVTDENQCVADDTVNVIIIGFAPNTAFQAADEICLGDSVSFINQTTFNGDTVVYWSWSFGNGDSSNVVSPSYLYTSTGPYTVQLFLTTTAGCTGYKRDIVNVYSQPVANYLYPAVICAGAAVSFFDASEIELPDTLSWFWDFNGEASYTSDTVIHSFSDTGNVSIRLVVTSSHGCIDSISRSFFINPELKADFGFDSVCLGNSTIFTDSSSSSVTNWQWYFGDNTFFSTAENPRHTYSSPGHYDVRLVVTNFIGCTDTTIKDVKIAAIPVASFTDSSACVGFPYSPKDNSFSLNDSIVRYDWTIDDSTYTNIKTPQHVFNEEGNYPVTLTVTSESGCRSSRIRVVTINPNPQALFSFDPLYGEAPLDVSFNDLSTNASTYFWSFGDGDSSTFRNPVHTYDLNGTYDIALRVYSDSGCTSFFTRQFVVAPTTLDLSVDLVEVTQTPQQNGYSAVTIKVTMHNLGTRLITSVKLNAIVGGGSVISETWVDSIPGGGGALYQFAASFIVSEKDAGSYVCVHATEVNNGEVETRTDNNRACLTLNGGIQLVGPLPNPASNQAVLGVILPKAGTIKVAVVDVAGQYVTEEMELSLPAGRSDVEIPAHKLSAAEYFIRVIYNDDKFIRKFVVRK